MDVTEFSSIAKFKEGDTVKTGQLLIRLDSTPPRTQLEMARGQLYSTQAAEARLMAEQIGAASIAFPPSLIAARSDPRVASAIALQQSLFTARRQTLASEVAVLRDSIAGLEAQLAGLTEARTSKEEQLRLLAGNVLLDIGQLTQGFVKPFELGQTGLAQVVVIGEGSGELLGVLLVEQHLQVFLTSALIGGTGLNGDQALLFKFCAVEFFFLAIKAQQLAFTLF